MTRVPASAGYRGKPASGSSGYIYGAGDSVWELVVDDSMAADAMTRKAVYSWIAIIALSATAAGCAMQQSKSQNTPTSQAPQQAAVMPPDLQVAVQNAELWGRALYDSYTAPKLDNDKAVERAIATVHQSVKDHCSGTYRAVAVMPPGAPKDRIVIYDIGEAPASQGIMVGRHYRVETTLDGKGVLLGEPSTTGCIILAPAAANVTTPSIITDDLSPTPSEYHVFLSLMYSRSFEVITQAGHWLVEHGKIGYIGRS
jgi:hypothetical protein